MVNNNRLLIAQQRLIKQGLDEVHQMVHLLKFASTVLVKLAVTREDVQFFQQFQRLAGADFVFLLRFCGFCRRYGCFFRLHTRVC